jgi:pre ATP-grasp domain-containing protein
MSSLLDRLEDGVPSQLFVHCATPAGPSPEPGEGVRGVERYAERALVLARSQDVVCVAGEVDPKYLAYLGELGLGPRPEHVVSASRYGSGTGRALWARLAGNTAALRALGNLVRRTGISQIQPLVASQGQFALAAALEVAADTEVKVAGGDPRLVEYVGQRDQVRTKAMELGIPVADGEVVELPVTEGRRRGDYNRLRVAMERHLGSTGQVIIRGSLGSAGSSTYIVGNGGEDVDGVIRRLIQHPHNRTYLVEVMVAATVSPNILLHVQPRGGAITCVGVTDQRWERVLVHGGNVYPSIARTSEAMVGWARRLAAWLQHEGYAGLLGLDFVEHPDRQTGEPRAFLAGVSPRVGGATYPLAVLERLNAVQRRGGHPESGAFVSGTIGTRHRTFVQLRAALEPALYASTTGQGAVLHDVGLLREGKCGVTVLGASRNDVLRAYGELQTRCRWRDR